MQASYMVHWRVVYYIIITIIYLHWVVYSGVFHIMRKYIFYDSNKKRPHGSNVLYYVQRLYASAWLFLKTRCCCDAQGSRGTHTRATLWSFTHDDSIKYKKIKNKKPTNNVLGKKHLRGFPFRSAPFCPGRNNDTCIRLAYAFGTFMGATRFGHARSVAAAIVFQYNYRGGVPRPRRGNGWKSHDIILFKNAVIITWHYVVGTCTV